MQQVTWAWVPSWGVFAVSSQVFAAEIFNHIHTGCNSVRGEKRIRSSCRVFIPPVLAHLQPQMDYWVTKVTKIRHETATNTQNDSKEMQNSTNNMAACFFCVRIILCHKSWWLVDLFWLALYGVFYISICLIFVGSVGDWASVRLNTEWFSKRFGCRVSADLGILPSWSQIWNQKPSPTLDLNESYQNSYLYSDGISTSCSTTMEPWWSSECAVSSLFSSFTPPVLSSHLPSLSLVLFE